MIVVDSSVWINYFNGRATPETDALERLADTRLVIGDLIMAEVLQGFRTEAEFDHARQIFAKLSIVRWRAARSQSQRRRITASFELSE